MSLSWENWFVQGVERVDGELLDAEALVGHLVAAGSMVSSLSNGSQDSGEPGRAASSSEVTRPSWLAGLPSTDRPKESAREL
jgi:hypothetical protein